MRQTGLFARVYNHDSLSRLTSESSPEAFNNLTSYTYDPNGMVTQRVRPAPNQLNPGQTVSTTYNYDALGRATDITYDDGATPNVHNLYDVGNSYGVTEQNPVGRLVSSQTGENNYNTLRVYSYDPMGRIINNWQCTPRVCSYLLSYSYDLLGNITSEFNGAGVILNYNYNGAGKLTGANSNLSDAGHPGTLLSNVHYGIAGPATSTLGNGLHEVRNYDPRLGLQAYSAGSAYSYSLTKAANGNVIGGNDSVNGAWSYSYDPFNRLATASNSGQGFAYDYDRFGNRWNQRLTTAGSSAQQPSYTFDGYNHITSPGVVYDALGNVTNDGTHSYSYDAENRMIKVDGGATAVYTYDAEGRRVKAKLAGGSKEFLYDLNGRAIVELDGTSGEENRHEIYAGGEHLATYANNTTYFQHQDWLGTKRVSTDPSGAVVDTCTNLPFGDDMNCTGSYASLKLFTDLEDDFESNLDHAWFRQLSTTQGRWMTPDPYSGSMDLGNPQSFNRYAYVGNDPIDVIDPLGLVCSAEFGRGETPCNSANFGGGGSGQGLGFGEFDFLEFANTPTFGVISPDPEFPFSDNSMLYLYYGNWDISGLIGIGLSPSIGHQLGPNALSIKTCAAGLKKSGQNRAGVNRAYAQQPNLSNAAGSGGFDWSILAAMAVRETGFQNIREYGGGLGRGIFQIDGGQHPEVSDAQAFNPAFNISWTARNFSASLGTFSALGGSALPAAIRVHNAGTQFTFTKALSGMAALDRGTAPKGAGNYVSNILQMADCFQ